jgi:hypothetical protein
VALVVGLVVLHIVGEPLTQVIWDKPCSIAGIPVWKGTVHLPVLFLFAPFAMLIGIIVQIFWEEKSITHPA